ncbi:MAG: diphthine--ammonia ligase [Candidatus Woesebacteria bacterium]|nr:diphthine--ammonia ligase [Candidatus Woesebacteria bacterium]
MKVAVMSSGGKDSTYAIAHCMEKGWDIQYLLSVKPTRKDCFLFHFATVEHTPKIAEILNLKHILTTCNVADPKLEADIIKKIIEKNPVDAVVLGGTGLQETQIRSLQEAMRPLGIEVFAAHDGLDQNELMKEMTNKGYEFMITQVASDGLMPWLGKVITKDNIQQLFDDGKKYGFHISGDGGYWDSFVYTAPIFNGKIIELAEGNKVVDDAYCGHMVFNKSTILEMHQIKN